MNSIGANLLLSMVTILTAFSRPVTSGVPQDSILGPLLFLIYINDLPESVSHTLPLLFADDTKCLGSVRTRSSITTDLQLDLDSLSLWSLTNNIAAKVLC